MSKTKEAGSISSDVADSDDSTDSASKKLSLSQRISRQLHRKKEKLLQSVGNVDQTDDKSFNRACDKLKKQQHGILKFHKHLMKYRAQLVETCIQSDKTIETMWKVVNPLWEDCEDVNEKLDTIVQLWRGYVDNLKKEVTTPLEAYMGELDKVSAKIAKRNRKLLDYDSSRHYLDELKEMPKLDEAKIIKQIKIIEDNYKEYEAQNSQLIPEIKELCGVHSKKVSTILNNFFLFESKFHAEVGKHFQDLASVVPALHDRHPHGTRLNTSSSSSSGSTPFLDHIKYGDDRALSGKTPILNLGVQYKAKALDSYEAKNANELTYLEDDIINVLEPSKLDMKVPFGWVLGLLERNGNKGFIKGKNIQKV